MTNTVRETNTMKRLTLIFVFAVIFVVSGQAQGFLNLDFESAQNMPGNPGYGETFWVTNALPDWTVDEGSIVSIYYESNVLDREQDVELLGGSLALSGNFSAELFLGGSLSQTGAVPNNAESLQFEANNPEANGDFSVTLGGQTLQYSPLAEGPNNIAYGVNIPAGMAGQMESLTFSCLGRGTGVVIDNIQFSTMSVPEPSEWAMIGVGAVLVGMRWQRRRSREIHLATDGHR